MKIFSDMSRKSRFRAVYSSIREMDAQFLGRKRKDLEQEAQKLRRHKEVIAKKINALKVKEQSYQSRKKEYDSMVQTVENKLMFHEPEGFHDRQQILDRFVQDRAKESQENGMEM